MRRNAVIAVCVLMLSMLAYAGIENRHASKWESRANVAESVARLFESRADSAVVRAAQAEATAKQFARNAGELGRTVKSRVAAVRAVVVPDTCARFIAQRDSLVDAMDSVATAWQSAYVAETVVSSELRTSNAALRVGFDSLFAAVKDRPKHKSRFGLGVFAGVCSDARPCAGAGVVLRF